MEELETVAGGIWSDAAEQLSANGCVGIGELELSTTALPELAADCLANPRIGNPGVAVAGAATDWVGLECRIFSGFNIEANPLGKCAVVLVTVPVLLVAISYWVVVAILSAAVSGARDLGSDSGSTRFEVEDGPGVDAGGGGDDFDDSGAGCQRTSMVGGAEDRSELDARFAGVVPGGDSAKTCGSTGSKLTKTI